MYVSGNTTRSARLRAASCIKAAVFWTVFAVSRNTGATLHAVHARQYQSLNLWLVSFAPATLTFGSQDVIMCEVELEVRRQRMHLHVKWKAHNNEQYFIVYHVCHCDFNHIYIRNAPPMSAACQPRISGVHIQVEEP
jgi:hypothetical protein